MLKFLEGQYINQLLSRRLIWFVYYSIVPNNVIIPLQGISWNSTRPKTNNSHLRIGLLPQKERILFQLSIFRGELLALGRVYDYWVVATQIAFFFLLGEMIQFDEHIFQLGWFNHQLD